VQALTSPLKGEGLFINANLTLLFPLSVYGEGIRGEVSWRETSGDI
jgi:hypothetical protein